MLPSSTRRRVAFGLLASFAVVASCHDAATAPSRLLSPTMASHDAAADAAEMAPAEASASLSLGESQLLGHYPQRTRVLAHVTGSTTLTDGVETWTYGIGGHPYAGGRIGFSLNSPYDPTLNVGDVTDWTDTTYVRGDLYFAQQGQGIFVGENGRPWTMTGHATASVRRLDATLGLGDGYASVGPYTMTEMHAVEGQYVLLEPRALEGPSYPAAVDPSTWLFTADSGGPSRPACAIPQRTWCQMIVPEAGTVTVTGYANGGPPTTARIHFTVPSSTIALHLSRESIAPGDTVFVTTEIIDAQSSEIYGYEYDAPQWATGTCMEGYGAGLASCYIVPTGPGTITVYANVDGRVKSAAKRIEVVDCPIFADPMKTDPLFVDPKVQALMRELAGSTGWDKSLAQQAERGAYLVSKDGQVSMKPFPPSPSLPPNPCSVSSGSLFRNELISQGYKILADIHTHPNAAAREPDPGNCYRFDGQLQRVAPPDGILKLNPRPSDDDIFPWRPPNTPPKYPGYVLGPKMLYRWENTGAGLQTSEFPVNACMSDQPSNRP